MPVRATSKGAFLALRESKQIPNLERKALEYVREHPGCSRRDISRGCESFEISSVSARVNALLEKGLLVEDGCKKCAVSGRSVNCLYVVENQIKQGA